MKEMEYYALWDAQQLEDPKLREELEEIRGNETEIYDRFYRELEFGTAGLRGVLGVGTNRMNIYTVRKATQGLADYLKEHFTNPTAAIGYDSRINSTLFAQQAACVLAANGITTHLYRELMPTPALSYAVRALGCAAGIVITASHNPAKYNGYKVYGPDGCQITSQAADAILGKIGAVDIFTGVTCMDFDQALAEGKIVYITEELIDRYLQAVASLQINPGVCAKSPLKLVYTPLNGSGNRCVRRIFEKIGIRDVVVVPEQEMPDGNFPTCPYPNPEIKQALQKGLELCESTGSDLLIATDPDCDRVGIAVKNKGEYVLMTGNEVGAVMLEYIASSKQKNGTLPKDPVAVKTIVTTTLVDAIGKDYGIEIVDVLTGFKYIGEVIAKLEAQGHPERFLLGFEESYGYLTGIDVRDKDAVNGSMIICEMAAYYALQGKTLVDVLEELYARYGCYYNGVGNFYFEGADGMAKMQQMMTNLRENMPSSIAGYGVCEWADYQKHLRHSYTGDSYIELPKTNALEYKLENKVRITIRPSGTEPKIKAYYMVQAPTMAQAQEIFEEVSAAVNKLLGV